MEIRISILGALLALLSAPLTNAQSPSSQSPSPQPSPSSPPSSTFYVQETETQFSINIDNDTKSDSGDVYMYMRSPAYSWVGFGFGSSMEGALMFVVYSDKSGQNLTLSPRLSLNGAHTEPSFSPTTQISLLPGTRIDPDSGRFIMHAVCRHCRAWPGGSLDVTSRSAPMIFAFGPGHDMMSNDKNAGLKRHGRFGRFEMDLVAATGTGGVPAANQTEMRGVRMLDGSFGKRDHDANKVAHAVLGCLAIFVVWPVNAVVGAWVRKRGWVHGVVSAVLVAMLVASYAMGGVAGKQFNRSRAFKSPHQIISIITLLPLLLTLLLPLPPITRLAPALLPKLHTPFATVTLVCLMLTGGLGLQLASQLRTIILVYAAVSLGVFSACFMVQRCVRKRKNSRGDEEDEQRLVSSGGGGMSLRSWKEMGSVRSESAASVERPANNYYQGSPNANGKMFGGGTMPGPQYLLNMHPGVPVQPGRY